MQKEQILYESGDIRLAYGNFEKPDLTRQKAHRHRYCEVLYMDRASGKFHVDGNAYEVGDGDLIAIRPGELHYMELAANTPYERLVLRFSPELFDSMDPERTFLQPFFDRPSGKRNHYPAALHSKADWAGLMHHMQKEPVRNTILVQLMILLHQMGNHFTKKLPDSPTDTLEYRITQYINNNLQEDLSAQALCKRFFISRTQLHHRFLRAHNTTVGKYISAQRMIHAQQLILEGHKPTTIYSQCGFRDYSSFYRAYKRYWNENPSPKIARGKSTIAILSKTDFPL